MNPSLLLKPLLEVLPWSLILGFVVALLKSPMFKGFLGELIVQALAKLFLDSKQYRQIHNVTLKTPDGTTQIDHVIVSRFGIFVIETKNYSGWIFGDAQQATWTQKIYRTTNKFQNPLRQNYKHVKALEELTKLPFDKFHSLVVFLGGCEFKTEMPLNVCSLFGYLSYVKSKNDIILSELETTSAFSTIVHGRLASSFATNANHVESLKQRFNSDAPRDCPKCGAPMIQRVSRRQETTERKFWGCSTFPKCRTTQPISEM